jgi:hypothetical protein
MTPEVQNRILLDSFVQLGVDREDAPKPLSLLYRYAREGGMQEVNRFLRRLDRDRLTQKDSERIRDHYFPEAATLSRRKTLAQIALAVTAPTFITSFLSTRYYDNLAQEARLPAVKKHYEKLAKYSGITTVVTGLPSIINATKIYPHLLVKLQEIDNSEECQGVLYDLSAAIAPSLQSLAQKLEAYKDSYPNDSQHMSR